MSDLNENEINRLKKKWKNTKLFVIIAVPLFIICGVMLLLSEDIKLKAYGLRFLLAIFILAPLIFVYDMVKYRKKIRNLYREANKNSEINNQLKFINADLHDISIEFKIEVIVVSIQLILVILQYILMFIVSDATVKNEELIRWASIIVTTVFVLLILIVFGCGFASYKNEKRELLNAKKELESKLCQKH